MSLKIKARKYCANHNNSRCWGIWIGKGLAQCVDKDMLGDCKPENCEYFNKLVVPVL